MNYKAKCCCEACSVIITGEPVVNGVCHCDNCKRRTGSAFVWFCFFKNQDVMPAEGPLNLYALTSAGNQNRWFCAVCGTTLLWTNDYFKDFTGIAGGCISEPALPPPDLTVSNINRCEWVTLPDDWRQSLNPPE
jgi:hypothetical protein